MRRMTWQLRARCISGAVVMATAGLFCAAAGSTASAATVYDVRNHPSVGDDSTGYVLRLDVGLTKNTFNADTIGDLTLTVDSADNKLVLYGHVTHNESGTTPYADASDDVYLLHAEFSSTMLTDGNAANGIWYGSNPDNAVYDNMLDDLLADATPYTGTQTTTFFDTSATRASFFLSTLTLTRVSDPLTTDASFPQNLLSWDAYPNDQSKAFFIEYDYKLGADANQLAAEGWLEKAVNGGRTGTDQLLFALSPQADLPQEPTLPSGGGESFTIPTPTALPMGLLALGLAGLRKRRRFDR